MRNFINLKRFSHNSEVYHVNGIVVDHKVAWTPVVNDAGKELLLPVRYDGEVEHSAFIKRRIAIPVMVVDQIGGLLVNRTFGYTYTVPDLFNQLSLSKTLDEFSEDFPNVRWAEENDRFVSPLYVTQNTRTSVSNRTVVLYGATVAHNVKIASSYLDALDSETFAKLTEVEIGMPWHELAGSQNEGRIKFRMPLDGVDFDPNAETMPESVASAIQRFKDAGNRLL